MKNNRHHRQPHRQPQRQINALQRQSGKFRPSSRLYHSVILKYHSALVTFNIRPAPGFHRCATQEDIVLSFTADAATAADQKAHKVTPDTRANSESQLKRILTSLSDDKAEDIVQIDLRGKTAIGDYMVICSGRSSRQVGALAEKLSERLKNELNVPTRIEGKGTGDWVLLDTGDVIVHIFRPEVREFYQLEKMWLPGSETTTAQS